MCGGKAIKLIRTHTHTHHIPHGQKVFCLIRLRSTLWPPRNIHYYFIDGSIVQTCGKFGSTAEQQQTTKKSTIIQLIFFIIAFARLHPFATRSSLHHCNAGHNCIIVFGIKMFQFNWFAVSFPCPLALFLSWHLSLCGVSVCAICSFVLFCSLHRLTRYPSSNV